MTVVRVHIHHLPNVPHLHASVIGGSVELVIFLVKLNASNSVSVPHELLDLLLVMDVPNPYNSVFTARNHVLSVS